MYKKCEEILSKLQCEGKIKISDYQFPPKQDLKLRLKDMLEDEVDEKYYLSDKMLAYMTDMTDRNGFVRGKRFNPLSIESKYAYTVTTAAGNRPTDNFINEPICLNSKGGRGGIEGLQPSMQDRIYDEQGISTAVTTSFMPSIAVREATKKGYKEAYDGDSVNLAYPESETRRGRVGEQVAQTLQCNDNMGVVEMPRIRKLTPKEGVVYNSNNIYNLFFTIFDLCCIINTKEKDKYERSRELLQILWQEIGKKEIWEEIRRFVSIQEKEILQSNLYENGIYEDRKLQSKISTSTSNSSKYNESITNREEMLNMWEDWKTRYTPQRWELSEQQFRQFNLFMQELSYETTQRETSMQNMWQTNERFRILQQTLFKIQEIWRPIENKISNGLRVRKLTPRETFRLMGFDDSDFEKASQENSNTQLYKQAGNSIVVNVLEAILKELLKGEDK